MLDIRNHRYRLCALFSLLSVAPVMAGNNTGHLRQGQTSCQMGHSFQITKNQVMHYLKGSWCSREKASVIMDLIQEIHPEVCVEIGAFTGSSVLPVAATLRVLGKGRIYAIDAWSNEEAIRHVSSNDPNHKWWSEVDMKAAKDQFYHMIQHWDVSPYCSILDMPSREAVNQIPEIDFLHLDGSGSEEGSLLDVELFLPKVKSGGYILLSNLFLLIDEKLVKMSSMWKLFDQCEIVSEMDNNNVVLFRKD